ncbi:LAFE_0C02256g1_1 [Lachancea fermentati]|uniref:tRNA-dihydrouridine(20) synthase [NAD(P)+] n=1 Tax=Lachancea fermentati TaxID=4955 RepID=A0A1G4M951_LACFM|nr:LAFE_0C02256g1_1 [Lachancea fermentati]
MVTYAGKLVLAPMVRAGELPTRLLALKYGADLVWSPEIVDKKLIQCSRQVNDALKTIDFVVAPAQEGKPTSVVFRTYPDVEKGKLIFQLGTSAPSLAVEAALKVIQDVDGIDVNAGCPKHFSIHSGMGAALLKTPEKLCSILVSLVEEVGKPHNKPISVKIRILDNEESTLSLVRKLCATGIANLTVHCRTTPMRNRQAPIRDYLPQIHRICKENHVSLIMNGAIQNRSHFLKVREELGLAEDVGGMMADCAEMNPTVFHPTPLPWYEAIRCYLEIARKFNHNVSNVKYMITRIVPGKSKFYQYFTRCKTMDEITYVANQMDETGLPLSDPSSYLEEKRQNEKNEKKRANDMKSQRTQQTKKHNVKEKLKKKLDTDQKRQHEQAWESIETKKIRTE